jgi:hypothetical protein
VGQNNISSGSDANTPVPSVLSHGLAFSGWKIHPARKGEIVLNGNGGATTRIPSLPEEMLF